MIVALKNMALKTTIGVGLLCGACAPSNAPESATQANMQINVHPSPQAHRDIIDIIRAGDNAMARNDAEGLNQAAALLAQFGAHPLSAHMDNLASVWSDKASALQSTPARPAYRGRVKGPAYRKEILAAGSTEVLEEIYYASENAELTLDTVSGGQLDIVVSEQNIKKSLDAVCQFSTSAEPISCQWLPLWTAKFSISITNNTQEPVSYLLVTN